MSTFKNSLIVALIFVSAYGYSQVEYPDYSNLTRKEKLKLMNVHGFVILVNGDTLFAKISNIKQTSVPITTAEQELIVTYPKELQEYKYLDKIPLNTIQKFYHGFPRRRYTEVRLYNDNLVLLEKVIQGKFCVFRESSVSGGGMISMPNSGTFGTQTTAVQEVYHLYVSKDNGELVSLKGKNKEIKQKLIQFLKGELDEKKLNKIKTRNDKIIELFKKLNSIIP